MTTGTIALSSIPIALPARRSVVVSARTVDAVTGPRISHLTRRLLTTRSGQDTPKKATAYAITIMSTDTKRLAIRANIQKAIDSGLIIYDNPTFSWRFATNNTPLMIVPAEQGSTPQIALYNFLSLNEKSAEILKFAMSSPYDIKTTETETITQDVVDQNRPSQQDVEALSWGDLKKLAVELGINTYQKKKPELTEIVLGVLAT